MKKTTALLYFFSLLATAFAFASCSSVEVRHAGAGDPADVLVPGDIVLRSAHALAANHWMAGFQNQEDHRFAHSGVVSRVDPAGGEVWVLHAHANHPGTHATEETLDDYVGRRDWGAFRVQADAAQRAEVARLIRAVPGFEIRFDRGFHLGDAGGWYCAELVWRLWQEAGVDLQPDPPYLFGRRYIPIDGLYFGNPQVSELDVPCRL